MPVMKKQDGTQSHDYSRAEDRHPAFDGQEKIMQMFSDNAKSYMQLSGLALTLTLTFAHEILHVPKDTNIADAWMIAMWICFLTTILAGAFYQYLAVKFLERMLDKNSYNLSAWLQPGQIYGVMLATFYAGSNIFTVYAIVRLRGGASHS
jgi:hypothetical protein